MSTATHGEATTSADVERYDPWETYWEVWKLRDGKLASTGREHATEAQARAVADGLTSTETEVHKVERVRRDPIPERLRVGWSTIETCFHEHAADMTKDDLARGLGTEFPPEFADWAVGMLAARDWRERHDAQVREAAAREALEGLSAWLAKVAAAHPERSAHIPMMRAHIDRYLADNHPKD
ncbi:MULTISPECIES: hypothetical protein [Brachybacterium]|uniref:Uncharacterized protein n=1 Tax=Brachybacterium kimchii TaxID=2942909 RepID=A0ABY4NB17_9MICO|nr:MULTISPECIES: hypothetical protein [Brachybacterium]MCG7309728.1 hypothetical protein [Brachybacterium sp. ACRRE]UQN30575.1 hypothetical protein M4486_04480 [Brachybacterium kimchii]